MTMTSGDGARFGTLAIHAGQEPEAETGAIMPPIFQTSTYVQPDVAKPKKGYDYARVQNPTREALERMVAALEAVSTDRLREWSLGDRISGQAPLSRRSHRQ